MCGIAGIIHPNLALVNASRVKLMMDALVHRGPDGEDHWVSPAAEIVLGHRRLAVIDLSEQAAQPMHYADRFTIVFNGEIYNYQELREALVKKGLAFRTQSDTEVILAAYAAYGDDCVQHFDGMFAFAIWDEKEKTLFAARDRFGEKPFFYHVDKEGFLFASEMKGLWAAGVGKQMRGDMLFNYLTIGYVQDPKDTGATFYENIYKLPARSFLKYDSRQRNFAVHQYWDIDAGAINTSITEAQAAEQLQELFRLSVNRRMRSDVPVGTSLSGGLDSSSVLAAICNGLGNTLYNDPGNNLGNGFGNSLSNSHNNKSSFKTFSAVFPGYSRDESAYINLLTEEYGVTNYKVQPGAETFLQDFDRICYHQETPFQSASIAVQYKVFELARQQGVTVLLDGQGADETLAGYSKYYEWYWRELFRTNKSLWKQELAAAASFPLTGNWNWKQSVRARLPAFADTFMVRSRARQQKQHPDLTDAFKEHSGISHYDVPHLPGLNGVLYYNTFLNGLEELLQYADRNSMAHGREVRLPFLNHDLVEFIFSLPSHYKIRNGFSKWVFRKSMEPVLPKEIVWRKDKIGFDPPQQQWMQHPAIIARLQEAKQVLVAKGILKASVVHKKNQPLDTHAADNFDWRYLVAGTLLR